MVFKTLITFVRSRGPDEFWRKRRIFRLASHFLGRRRNCYSLAIRAVHRALVYATKARRARKRDMRELWNLRIQSAAKQYNLSEFTLTEGLERSNIMLNLKSLSDLAIWEPQSFEVLAAIAREKILIDGIKAAHEDKPGGRDLDLDLLLLRGKLFDDK